MIPGPFVIGALTVASRPVDVPPATGPDDAQHRKGVRFTMS